MAYITLRARSQALHDRPAGFDYLRIVLAAAVILWHSWPLSYGRAAEASVPEWLNVAVRSILPMFFGLSGYLVAASLLRTTLFTFFGHRIIRIVPALFVEVLLSAFVLGPMMTGYRLADYFTGRTFFTYFFNIVGYIHYTLPSVFLHNPYPGIVNGQLWTVPFELQCYIALGALAALRVVRARWLFVLVLALVQGAVALIDARQVTDAMQGNFGVPGNVLVVCFLSGVALQLFASSIPWTVWLFAASCALGAVLLYFPFGRFFVAIPLSYATIYVGLLHPPRTWLVRSGDYSYGLYLFGFPMQQAFASLGAWTHDWILSIVVVLPCTWAVAYASWNLIERPALGRRHRLASIERGFNLLVGRLRRSFQLGAANAASD